MIRVFFIFFGILFLGKTSFGQRKLLTMDSLVTISKSFPVSSSNLFNFCNHKTVMDTVSFKVPNGYIAKADVDFSTGGQTQDWTGNTQYLARVGICINDVKIFLNGGEKRDIWLAPNDKIVLLGIYPADKRRVPGVFMSVSLFKLE